MTAKTSGKPRRGAPKYHRLTIRDRIIIWKQRKAGKSISEIARWLGVSKSTVSRELRRNVSHKGYRHQYAGVLAKRRTAAKVAKRRKFTEEMWQWAVARLALGWSFAVIVGRAKREGVAMVCAETLYKEYYRRQKLVMADKSGEVLPPLPKARRKR